MAMKKRILVVDDQAGFRSGFRQVLEGQPFAGEIMEAGDGTAAVRMAEEHSPDLIFMDISMPGLNGFEASRQIHRRSPGIKIVFVTVHAKKTFVETAFQAGASGYLVKKNVSRELPAAMERIMRDERYVSEGLSES